MSFGSDYELDLQLGKEEAKKALKDVKCSVHNKKARLSYDYDNDGANVYITKYCCSPFAKEVSNILSEIVHFNNIVIEDQ